VRAEPVGGYDLTFSAPKSVSVLFGVGSSEVRAAVRDAHDAAVRDAIGYLEREACVTRRGSGRYRRLRGAGFLAAAYRHVASRARDPQVHTHVVVANMTHGEGRWTRLDGASLFRHGKTAGYLYQASLRLELTERLGVAWEPIQNGHAEVTGVPREVVAEFSRRRAAIEEELLRRGLSGPRAAQVAALDTREAKDLALAPPRLHDEWHARAAEHGLTRDCLDEILEVGRVQGPTRRELARVARRLGGPHGLTRRLSTFDRRDVVQAWATVVGQGRPSDIEAPADGWLTSRHAQQLEPDPGGGRARRVRAAWTQGHRLCAAGQGGAGPPARSAASCHSWTVLRCGGIG
jgi:conjugative relaxase-like TrwC/TraI family protein